MNFPREYKSNMGLKYLLPLLLVSATTFSEERETQWSYKFKPKSTHSIVLELNSENFLDKTADYGTINFNSRREQSIFTINFDDENCTLQKNVQVRYLTKEGFHFEYFEKLVLDGESLTISYEPIKKGWANTELKISINEEVVQFKPHTFPKKLFIDSASGFIRPKQLNGAISEDSK